MRFSSTSPPRTRTATQLRRAALQNEEVSRARERCPCRASQTPRTAAQRAVASRPGKEVCGIDHDLEPRRADFIEQLPSPHYRTDHVVNFRLERQSHLVAIGDLDRLAHRIRPCFPCASAHVIRMVFPHVVGIERASAERDDPGIEPPARRGQNVEPAQVVFKSRRVGIAKVERAGDRGHRQPALAERPGDPPTQVFVDSIRQASAVRRTTY